mgnify:CR=1 FL=1|jgi:TusA-related sulfurtransferase
MTHNLDLRGIACPMNFVKTKLYLDKLDRDETLQVCLDAGEPIESVYASIQAEGHQVNEPEEQNDGSYRLTIKKIILVISLFLCCLPVSAVESSTSVEEQIQLARELAMCAPTDVVKRLHLARLFRRSGNNKQAAIEYLNITVINPNYQTAYHEMLFCKPTIGQIDEAIARLNKLDEARGKQLLTKMVLSELYEYKEDYYQAARVLVDLQYSQTIPQKYVAQIASRIHMLLGKTKDTRTIEKAIEQKTNVEEEEFNPSTPLPMPDATITKDAPFNKLRPTKLKEGYGHAQLSP